MKLYSDSLSTSDLADACAAAGRMVYFAALQPIHRAKVRARGWKVKLASLQSRRYSNTGTHGADTDSPHNAASWADHGRFFAVLFDRDPGARLACYDGREDFHAKTKGEFAK